MFWILGIPSAALWGMVTVVTSVLPVVGAAGVWAPGAVYLAATGHWTRAIILAVFGTGVISTVDNFLRPRLVGGRVGLSELVMFFSVLGGLQVFGVLGIVLGPVLFAIAAGILDVLSDEAAASGGRRQELAAKGNTSHADRSDPALVPDIARPELAASQKFAG
jgi:predicted PurR-regulated permease PerM